MLETTASRRLRRLHYYLIPKAGAMIGLGKSQSYEAAKAGIIPTIRDGKFSIVPRRPWDLKVKRLLRGTKARRSSNGA